MNEVNLIGITKPSAYTDCTTANELVAWAARVSNPSNQSNKETAPKLIKYLINNKHWSPLEIVNVSMEIKTTRDIARQILRHRSFSFQEYSQRYADPTNDLGYFTREARLQDPSNRQNSIRIESNDDNRVNEQWSMMQADVKRVTQKAYKTARGLGIAKEQARAVLPEGMMQSVVIMSGSLRSWVHYCDLRMGNGTQLEHADIAAKCWDIIGYHFPDVKQAIHDMNEDRKFLAKF